MTQVNIPQKTKVFLCVKIPAFPYSFFCGFGFVSQQISRVFFMRGFGCAFFVFAVFYQKHYCKNEKCVV